MTNKNESKDLKLNENEKEDLYSLFYEIISEIKNCKIEIEEDDFKKNIQTISSKQLIEYIHDTIKILLKKKFEEGKEEQKKEETQLKLMKKIPIETNEINQLEYTLKKLEQKERNLIKLVFKYKLQKDAMKNKIEDLLDIEDEYEEMKEKLKYEDGRFLENDRKDNEILILRQENTNLKKVISDNEKNYKKLEDELIEKEKLIVTLETKIEKLNKTLEDKQREINMYSTINYENNINNSNYSTNIISNKQENTNDNNINQNLKLYQLQKIKSKLLKKKQKNSENKINETFEHSKMFIMKKFFTSKHNFSNINNSYIKISKLPNNVKSISSEKISDKNMPLIRKNSDIQSPIIIQNSGFYSTRKLSSKSNNKIFEK